MPPTSKPPTITESLAKLDDIMDKFNTHLASQNIKLELVSKSLAASAANLVSITTKTTTLISTITRSGSNDHTTNNFHHPTTTHDTQISPHILCAVKPSTLATDSDAFSPANQPLLVIPRSQPSTANPTHKPLKIQANLNRPSQFAPTAAPHDIVIRDRPTIFSNLLNQPLEPSFQNIATNDIQVTLSHGHNFQGPKTFHPDRQSPPKLVFLQTGHEPPWLPCEQMYKIMSLEDKAHFQAWSIDTSQHILQFSLDGSVFGLLKQGRIREPKEVRPGRGEFHENPTTCICEDTEAKSRSKTLPLKFGNANIDSDEVVTDQDIENELEASDQDEDDDLMDHNFYNHSMRQMWMMILQYLNYLSLKSYSQTR
ncbi:hypothetical protein Tco_0205086 [Tanacetum coccineum]